MQVPFRFFLEDLDLRPRGTRYKIDLTPPIKFELVPMFIFSVAQNEKDNYDVGMTKEAKDSISSAYLQKVDIDTSRIYQPRPTSTHYPHKDTDIDPLTSLPPPAPIYDWDSTRTRAPRSSTPSPTSQSPAATPPHRPLEDWEIRSHLAHFYKDKNFHRKLILAEQHNPYRHIDMNEHWSRPRTIAQIHNQDFENLFPVLRGGPLVKKEVTESFNSFSFTLQYKNLQFDEETLRKKGFVFIFKGDGDAVHGDLCGGKTCYKRKPGAWWGTKKKVLSCCRGVRFLDDIERQADKLQEKIVKWHQDGRGGSKVIGIHNTDSATAHILNARDSSRFDWIHRRCNKGSGWGYFKFRSEAGDGSGDRALKRTAAARNLFQDKEQRKYYKCCRPSDQVMSEEWRKRRREQEKNAGRWTDGTLLMDRMWAEFYWVTLDCDDPRRGPYDSRGKARGSVGYWTY